MITIKLTTEYPQVALENLTPHGSSEWGNCRFLINQEVEQCDYWMVIDGLLKPETTACPPENVILFTAEPPTVRHYSRAFLDQFGAVCTCQREIKHSHVVHTPPPLPWYMKLSYDEITTRPIHKVETLSMIASNKQMTTGHRKRYEFALRLKAHFGNTLQLYGRGIREVDDKWDVQAPCRYAIVVENTRSADYFSEKITDCFLTETFPLYDGCPNIGDYFSSDAFQKIDIDDFEGTVAAIENLLANPDHFEQHRTALQQAKAKYLQNYSLFALLSRQATLSNHSRQSITLSPEVPQFAWLGWRGKLKSGLQKFIR